MYEEILKLKELLEKEEIPFDFVNKFDGYGIAYPSIENVKSSIIEHKFSYGSSNDLLEMFGLTKYEADDVEGHLTAQEVFRRIKEDYTKE